MHRFAVLPQCPFLNRVVFLSLFLADHKQVFHVPGAAVRNSSNQVLRGVVFADVTGYSKLGERAVVNFVNGVIGGVNKMLDLLPAERRPVVRNTWGDAFYFVFNRVEDAGTFALSLSEYVQETDWSECDLPDTLNIRVSLHAAPLFPCWDAVIGAINYTGTHTSRAARIEPVTPPGSVYCSQAFYALTNALAISEYSCTYVGNMPLAKKFVFLVFVIY